MGKSKIVQETKDELKNKQKENKTMKNSTKKTAIVSVTLTILFIGSLIGMFILGVKYQENYTDKITSQAKVLSQVAEAKK